MQELLNDKKIKSVETYITPYDYLMKRVSPKTLHSILTFDEMGNIIKTTLYKEGEIEHERFVSYKYDEKGKVSEKHSWSSQYDVIEKIEYDELGRESKILHYDPKNDKDVIQYQSLYKYDSSNRIIEHRDIYPDGNQDIFTFKYFIKGDDNVQLCYHNDEFLSNTTKQTKDGITVTKEHLFDKEGQPWWPEEYACKVNEWGETLEEVPLYETEEEDMDLDLDFDYYWCKSSFEEFITYYDSDEVTHIIIPADESPVTLKTRFYLVDELEEVIA